MMNPTFFKSYPNKSSPATDVTYLFLLRAIRLIVTTDFALMSACFASAALALAVFFWASRAARF